MGDIKITHVPSKEGQLDTTPMAIIDVNMQSALAMYQSRFLVNTSMETGKSLQAMETKIEKLNKKIDKYKKDFSLKERELQGWRTRVNIFYERSISRS